MFDTIAQNYGVNAPQAVQGGASGRNWQKAEVTDPMQLMSLYNTFGGPGFWAGQGYTGQRPTNGTIDQTTGDPVADPYAAEWSKFVQDKGYGLNYAVDGSGFKHGQLTQNGQAVAGVPEAQWSQPNNDGFNAMRAVVGTVMAGAGAYAGLGGGAAGAAGDIGGDLAVDGAIGGGAATSAPAYGGVGTAGAGAGTDAILGADGLAYAGGAGGVGSTAGGGGSSPGLWNSLANGKWGDAASAAGDWATSPGGVKTLGGVASTLINANASGNALDALENSTNQSNALQKYMYDTTRGDWAPYRALGQQGTTGYSNLLKDPSSITQDPGYQFDLNQGQTAIDRSAAGKGNLYSGATLKALQRFGQDYGSTKLDNSLGRFANAAQLGATGTAGTQNAGTNYTNQVGANTMGLGSATAGNALYNGTLWSNALNGAVSAYGQPKP